MDEDVCFGGTSVVHVLLATVLFGFFFAGLFVACETYFVPSLEILGKKMGLSESVQGATLLAVGSSLPELFTASIGLIAFEGANPGPATNVGSALFNTAVIIGGATIVRPLNLSWEGLIRDGLFYALSLILLFVFYTITSPQEIAFWEALSMLALYGTYVYVLSRNNKSDGPEIRRDGVAKSIEFVVLSTTENDPTDQTVSVDASEVNRSRGESTSHDYVVVSGAESVTESAAVTVAIDRKGCIRCVLRAALFVFEAPFKLLFKYTIPAVRTGEDDRGYLVTACLSIVWIGGLTWLVVEIAESTSHCLGIDANLTGVTVLAIGSSLPDMFASIVVAKDGKANMAVSNALGSNIFDILVCLGVPFSLKSITESFANISVGTRNTSEEFVELTLFAIVQLVIVGVMLYVSGKQRGGTPLLSNRHGTLLISLYVSFLVFFSIEDLEFFSTER